MSKVIFNYNGINTIIQCETNNKMEDICKKFIGKTRIDINQIYFLYNGNEINLNMTFYEQANNIDKKKMK